MNEMKPAGASPVDLSLGLVPEWLAGAYMQAWRADTVRSWPAENAARYTVPLFTAEQVREAVAAERERRAEPLRRLGARLASLLDEDQWAECEALLLQAGVGPNVANNLHAQARAGVK